MRFVTVCVGLTCCILAPTLKPAFAQSPPNTEAQPAAAQGSVRLIRDDGEHRYRLTMKGYDKLNELRVVQTTEFSLKTAADGKENVEIASATRVLPPSRDPEAVPLDAACRQSLGGDEKALARFAFTPLTIRKPNDIVPECVSRDVFVTVTDVMMFLSIQSREFGMDKLSAPGDKHAFEKYESNWSHLPEILHGRHVCAGGELLLEKIESGKAHVRWQPQPFDVGTVHQKPSGICQLMAGTEKLAMTMVIDAATGTLLEATCELHETEMQGWAPFRGEKVPDRADWPKTSGIPMKFSRQLKLERIDASGGDATQPR